MARVRQKRKPHAEMNVVPYIDVMLVLLVIFMVTAPMMNQGVKVDLPKVGSEALAQDNNAQVLTISIKADKSFFWNMGKEVDTDTQQAKAQTLPELINAVAAIMSSNAALGKSVQVMVRGDKSLDYGVVMATMAGLQQAKVANVGLITEAP
jgi:biopolymer transport protein TolR